MYYVVDTHALVWFLQGHRNLGYNARKALESQDATIVIPSIVLLEIAHLNRRGRIQISLDQVLQFVENSSGCSIHPLDEIVVQRTPSDLEIHDAVIVATALVYQEELGEMVTLITKDEAIRKANHVAYIW